MQPLDPIKQAAGVVVEEVKRAATGRAGLAGGGSGAVPGEQASPRRCGLVRRVT